MIVVVIIIDVFVCLCFFPFFCYVHQDFRSYAMVQFGVSDLKLHSISRAQLVKKFSNSIKANIEF